MAKVAPLVGEYWIKKELANLFDEIVDKPDGGFITSINKNYITFESSEAIAAWGTIEYKQYKQGYLKREIFLKFYEKKYDRRVIKINVLQLNNIFLAQSAINDDVWETVVDVNPTSN